MVVYGPLNEDADCFYELEDGLIRANAINSIVEENDPAAWDLDIK
jgi:hypothetical protein